MAPSDSTADSFQKPGDTSLDTSKGNLYVFDAPTRVDFLNHEHEELPDENWFSRLPQSFPVQDAKPQETAASSPVNTIPIGANAEDHQEKADSHTSQNMTTAAATNSSKRVEKVFIPSTPSTPYSSAVQPHKRRRVDENEAENEVIDCNLFSSKEDHSTKQSTNKDSEKMNSAATDQKPSSISLPSNLLTSFSGKFRRMDTGKSRRVPLGNDASKRKSVTATTDNSSLSLELQANKKRKRATSPGTSTNKLVVNKASKIEKTAGNTTTNKAAKRTTVVPVLTVPHTPALHTGKRTRAVVHKTLTPEKSKKQRHQRTDLVTTFKSDRGITIPKPFRFRTEERIHNAPAATDSETNLHSPYREKREILSTPSRFKSHPAPVAAPLFKKELTIPQSPNFTISSKLKPSRQNDITSTPYEEIEKQKRAFYATPSRFKSQPDAPRYTSPPRGVTVPESPAVLHRQSSRTTRPISSTEERELAEMAKRPKFKARPVNRNILMGDGKLGVKFLRSSSPTKPLPFSFSATTDYKKRRAQKIRAKIQKEMAERQIKLQEEKSHAAVGTKRKRRATTHREPAPKRRKLELTVPKSPNLSAGRQKHRTDYEEVDPNQHKFVARPMPDFSSQHQKVAKTEPKRLTTFAPFQLATEKRSELHALKNGYDTHSATKSDSDQSVSAAGKEFDPAPTVPQPFRLQSEILHEEAVAKMLGQLQQEDEREHQLREFKALPLPNHKPFTVNHSSKPATKPLNISTFSEKRAENRRRFDEKRKQKLLEAEKQAEKSNKEQALRQQQEILQLRRQIDKMNKARPLPSFYGKGPVKSRNTYFNKDCVVVEKENSLEIRRKSVLSKKHSSTDKMSKVESSTKRAPVSVKESTAPVEAPITQMTAVASPAKATVPVAPPAPQQKSVVVLEENTPVEEPPKKENKQHKETESSLKSVKKAAPQKNSNNNPLQELKVSQMQNTKRHQAKEKSFISKANKQVVVYNEDSANGDEKTVQEEIVQVPFSKKKTLTLSRLDRMRLAARMGRMMMR